MKIFLDTIGCRLNQSEIETLGAQFRGQGHEIIPSPNEADLAVINTCAVTVEAAAESRKTIRRAARAGAKDVVVTGCWATFAPNEAANLAGVSRVVRNPDKDALVPQILQLPQEIFDREPVAREPLPGARLRTRAFIKVQDGCENRCTFCITTVVRGESRSRPIEAVLADVNAATRGGAQEVVLTGVHLGSWGQDLDGGERLKFLVQAVLNRTDVVRVRLSSLEPWDLDDSFFELWRDQPRLCPHLHLPLQAGCDATLRRMARKTTQASFRKLVQTARQVRPDMAITTDLIAGFPGETAAEFADTFAFVEEMQFAGAHIFTYSERPGTAAANMPNPVAHPVRKARNAELRAIVNRSEAAYRQRHEGSVLSVLWENAVALGPNGWQMSGMTENGLRVTATAPKNLWNRISPVKITDASTSPTKGSLIQETPHAQ